MPAKSKVSPDFTDSGHLEVANYTKQKVLPEIITYICYHLYINDCQKFVVHLTLLYHYC